MRHILKIALFLVGQMFFCVTVGDTYKFHLSDTWYPSKGKFLQRKLIDLEHTVKKTVSVDIKNNNIKAIIVPHAGYDYSGSVASSVYKHIKPNMFERVIILAPAHHAHFEGVVMVGSEYDRYKSPLGHIPLDVAALKKLDQSPLFIRDHQIHEMEHSIEVQIPFIQKYCGQCKILPLLVGNLNESEMATVVELLLKLFVQKTLLVISADFIHAGQCVEHVFCNKKDVDDLLDVDTQVINQICKGSRIGFHKMLQLNNLSLCGQNCVDILIEVMQKKYGDSLSCVVTGHDRQNNFENCISYIGMIITSKLV